MATTEQMENVGHAVLIASPLYGHMIPLLDFAKRLSAHVHVTYVASASKLEGLKQRELLSENAISSQYGIEFIGLFDGNDDEYEITSSKCNLHLESAIDQMHKPLLQLLSSSEPISATRSISRSIDLIICDIFVHMPIRYAYKRNIIVHFFLPNTLIILVDFITSSMGDVNGTLEEKFARQIIETLPLANGVICNSIHQLDKEIIDKLHRQSPHCSHLPIRFVAPLISEELDDKQHKNTMTYVKEWLDAQWKAAGESPSVIYIAFGSMVCFPPEQIVEIVRSLLPFAFIWSLKAKFRKHLPSSFIDGQNCMFLDWAPQRFILSHPAIRLFVSHGAWNSLLECMLVAKPILVWPMFGDQIINGNNVEHKYGIGQYIKHTSFADDPRIVSCDELSQYLKQMFDREVEYVGKSKQLQQIIMDANENDSRVYFHEIIEIVNDQVTARTQKKKNI